MIIRPAYSSFRLHLVCEVSLSLLAMYYWCVILQRDQKEYASCFFLNYNFMKVVRKYPSNLGSRFSDGC